MKRYYQNVSVLVDPTGDAYFTPAVNFDIVGRGNQAFCTQDSETDPTMFYSAVSDKLNAEAEPDATLHEELKAKYPLNWNTYAEMIAWIQANLSLSVVANTVDQTVSGE